MNLVKKTIATATLLIISSITVFADGDVQFPLAATPSPVDSTSTKQIINDDYQKTDEINLILILLKNVKVFF